MLLCVVKILYGVMIWPLYCLVVAMVSLWYCHGVTIFFVYYCNGLQY